MLHINILKKFVKLMEKNNIDRYYK